MWTSQHEYRLILKGKHECSTSKIKCPGQCSVDMIGSAGVMLLRKDPWHPEHLGSFTPEHLGWFWKYLPSWLQRQQKTGFIHDFAVTGETLWKTIGRPIGKWENHRKTIGKCWFNADWMMISEHCVASHSPNGPLGKTTWGASMAPSLVESGHIFTRSSLAWQLIWW